MPQHPWKRLSVAVRLRATREQSTVRRDKGAVQDPRLPLAFGNFGSGYHANDRMLRGRLFAPKIFAKALSQDEIVAVQSRSGCAPSCGASTCGSDGCGGSCGSCSAGRHCLPAQDQLEPAGTRKCQMPTTITANGFYDGDGVYRIRFSPPFEGFWTYTTHSNTAQLDGKSGSFTATAPTSSNHGPVESQGFRLVYADGTPHFSVGTTSYQWTSKSFEMQAQTIQTLREGQGDGPVFNKMRMTVFPKWVSEATETGAFCVASTLFLAHEPHTTRACAAHVPSHSTVRFQPRESGADGHCV